MNYKDYFEKLDEDSKYQEVEAEFRIILDLADSIFRLRMEKGWTQAELAQRAMTKQANISRLESGLSNPSISFLQKLAKAFETNLLIKFEKHAQGIDFTTDSEDAVQAIPLPYNGFGKKLEGTRASSDASVSTRSIYA